MKFDVKILLEYNEEIEANSKGEAEEILLRQKLMDGGELYEIETRDENGDIILEDKNESK